MTGALIVIPARYGSTRFPGKPLVDLNGKSMLQHVWEKCIQVENSNNVIVATDDTKIENHCKKNGIQVMMTSSECKTGTDRLYQIALRRSAEIFINVQGDEPLIAPNDIKLVMDAAYNDPKSVFNAMCEITNENEYYNPNVPKVVIRKDGSLLYISRAAIPANKKLEFTSAMKQVCIYAFPFDALCHYGECQSKTQLEEIEDLEILRFIELGYDVQMVEVSGSSVAVDTPDDLDRVRNLLIDM